ncbi:hypothetical protein GCM10027566_35110 [Arachidicoccus ginsenosidivorans]
MSSKNPNLPIDPPMVIVPADASAVPRELLKTFSVTVGLLDLNKAIIFDFYNDKDTR